MLLPDKHVTEQRCILRIGGEVLQFLKQEEASVSQLWNDCKELFKAEFILSFDFFALSLNFLFTVGLVSYAKGKLRRVIRDL